MPTFEEIAEPFRMVDRDMRLELLLEYADNLPPLPEEYESLREAGLEMVHECQSPVFLHVEVAGDTVHLYGHVPREAPTARAFVSILHEAFDGASPAVVAEAPDDPLRQLGLAKLLGMQRTQGLSAIHRKVKHDVAQKSERDAAARSA